MPDKERDSPEYTRFAALPATLGQGSSSMLPPALHSYVQELEAWAIANRQEAHEDNTKFWAFKIPAILCSATSGIFAYRQWALAGLIASGIASVCIVIDGLLRAGMLRGIHVRAFHDIRALESHVKNEWLTGQAEGEPENTLVVRILKDATRKRSEIERYVSVAEAGSSETKAK